MPPPTILPCQSFVIDLSPFRPPDAGLLSLKRAREAGVNQRYFHRFLARLGGFTLISRREASAKRAKPGVPQRSARHY